jgi:predicted DNA-binding transcriptional regulator AlpA
MTMQDELNDLLDLKAVCSFFGGNKPIHPSTLYRGIERRCYPAPVKIGPGSSRWLKKECDEALEAMIRGRAAA